MVKINGFTYNLCGFAECLINTNNTTAMRHWGTFLAYFPLSEAINHLHIQVSVGNTEQMTVLLPFPLTLLLKNVSYVVTMWFHCQLYNKFPARTCMHTHKSSILATHRRLLSVRPYSQPLRGSWTNTVTVSPLLKGRSFGLDEEGWDTRALMALPPPRPRDSPTELERERLGRGDGAAEGEKIEKQQTD